MDTRIIILTDRPDRFSRDFPEHSAKQVKIPRNVIVQYTSSNRFQKSCDCEKNSVHNIFFELLNNNNINNNARLD